MVPSPRRIPQTPGRQASPRPARCGCAHSQRQRSNGQPASGVATRTLLRRNAVWAQQRARSTRGRATARALFGAEARATGGGRWAVGAGRGCTGEPCAWNPSSVPGRDTQTAQMLGQTRGTVARHTGCARIPVLLSSHSNHILEAHACFLVSCLLVLARLRRAPLLPCLRLCSRLY